MTLGRVRIFATRTLPLDSHSLLFEVVHILYSVIAVIRTRSHIYFKNLIYVYFDFVCDIGHA
jgi:hypothetical protein